MTSRLNHDDLIARFKAAHGDRYDYSLVEYVGAHTKVKIVCREHGVFEQTPKNHSGGSGCPRCRYIKQAQFNTCDEAAIIERMVAVHGDRYDYSSFFYAGGAKKSTIICREHGPFQQAVDNHLAGHGCPECKKASISQALSNSREEILQRFKEKHGDKYDYSKFIYAGLNRMSLVVCREHGEFEITPSNHFLYSGCPQCASRPTIKNAHGTEILIQRFKEVHGNQYDYSRVVYAGATRKVEIICQTHGPFMQTPGDHSDGHGCSLCIDIQNPRANIAIHEFVSSITGAAQREASIFNDRRTVDVLHGKVAIEHNGLSWHSEEFHKDARGHMLKKKRDAEALGYRLLHIMEDEWTYRRSACELLIRHALGVCEKINARDCLFEIRPRGDTECEDFLERNHIQGASAAALYGTLWHTGQMVMVMSLDMLRSNRKNADRGQWELTRMASSVQVRGGATKLMTNLLRQRPEIQHITTYCDHRLFDGRTYDKMGFAKTAEYGPDYTYVVSDRREHKSNYQKARIAERFGIDMTGKTEREAMAELGYFRIWDCGKSRYEWHK